MYIYIFLIICALTAADNTQRFWNLFEDIVTETQGIVVPEDALLNITELAHKYGYPIEEHTVVTEDGYILYFYRIPQRTNTTLPVVFLMHGIAASSDDWLLLGPGKALAYVLAERGFDVWMGNARGNKYSDKHSALTSKMSKFWDFTWEEIALYDVPAMIDYILQLTNRSDLYYIGYSQGTTVGYVMCSLKPEYNEKIKVMFSIAPVAWMGNTRCKVIRILSPASKALKWLLKGLNTYASGAELLKKIWSLVCVVLPGGCVNILTAFSEYETKVNQTFLSVILGHFPTGSSIHQFEHYGQLVQSGRFSRYDYGLKKNKQMYGTTSPPDYDLSKVVVPVVLFYSPIDIITDFHDVEKLKVNLPNLHSHYYINDFTHIDYNYAEEAVEVVFNIIIDKILDFENTSSVDHRTMSKIFKGPSITKTNDLREIPKFWD